MKHKEVIKKLESIGVEINYMQIDINMLEEECHDPAAFRTKICSTDDNRSISA